MVFEVNERRYRTLGADTTFESAPMLSHMHKAEKFSHRLPSPLFGTTNASFVMARMARTRRSLFGL
ncbi:MAG: hypothetical protein HOB79_08265 [Rhodospirillaceae bacterium]|nr:hypothetical protein [Rhodospirillaceae bacterium]